MLTSLAKTTYYVRTNYIIKTRIKLDRKLGTIEQSRKISDLGSMLEKAVSIFHLIFLDDVCVYSFPITIYKMWITKNIFTMIDNQLSWGTFRKRLAPVGPIAEKWLPIRRDIEVVVAVYISRHFNQYIFTEYNKNNSEEERGNGTTGTGVSQKDL